MRMRFVPVLSDRLFFMAIGAAGLIGPASALNAQCAFSTVLIDAYRAQGLPQAHQQQRPAAGWRYERTGPTGGGRMLLEGIESVSWEGGAWGTTTEQYNVPLVGPIYSPVGAQNQNPFHRRDPSFDGVMMHPNFGLDDARAVMTVSKPTMLTSLVVDAEDLGSASPHVEITAVLERAAGGIVVLVPTTAILSLAPAQHLSPGVGVLPLSLAVGDRVVVSSGDGGDAAEDWLNVNATVGLSGPPLIAAQPIVFANCNADASIQISAPGATTYRWRKDGVPLNDGPTDHGSTVADSRAPVLRIFDFAPGDVGNYDCVVTNPCGDQTSDAILAVRCFADWNCIDGVDSQDFFDFLEGFFTGEADFNGFDGTDSQDFFDFLEAFFNGC